MMQQKFQVFTDDEKKFILENVLSSHTEYMNARHLGTDGASKNKWNHTEYDHPMMCLRLVQRNSDKEGVPCSDLWDFFEPIFHRTRKSMNLPFSHVLRASINLTFYSPDIYGNIHKDHYTVDHYNMIMHLSPISQGGTFIFDEDHNILEESSATVWSATSFGGLWHAQGFCAPDETRAVVVITWS